ncbi:MAG: hypothetical protein WDA75_02305 [Candidatus Latescibacterota bacterium]
MIAVLLGVILCLPLLHQLHHAYCSEPAICPYHLLLSGFIVCCYLGTLVLHLLPAPGGRLRVGRASLSPRSLPAFSFTRRGPPRR